MVIKVDDGRDVRKENDQKVNELDWCISILARVGSWNDRNKSLKGNWLKSDFGVKKGDNSF